MRPLYVTVRAAHVPSFLEDHPEAELVFQFENRSIIGIRCCGSPLELGETGGHMIFRAQFASRRRAERDRRVYRVRAREPEGGWPSLRKRGGSTIIC